LQLVVQLALASLSLQVSVVSQAGPGGAILAYLIIGVMLYFLMSSIGELATFYPVSGSFSSYSTRFVDSSLGFTMGWLYWVIWVLVTSVDIIIASSVLDYWEVFHFFSLLLGALSFFVILFLLNIFSVKAFGETEFWLSLIKVLDDHYIFIVRCINNCRHFRW
jgi:AAT family amino acid transporter